MTLRESLWSSSSGLYRGLQLLAAALGLLLRDLLGLLQALLGDMVGSCFLLPRSYASPLHPRLQHDGMAQRRASATRSHT